MALDLTPASSGPIARAFDRVAQRRFTALDLGLDRAFDPDACPAELLPWLAYHYGVDVWSTAWSVALQRSVVRDAYQNFRTRGTRAGLIVALGSLVNEVTVIEWWEEASNNATFRIEVTGDDTATSAEAQNAIAEIVKRTAPHSRPWTITVETQITATFATVPTARFYLLTFADARQPAIY